MRCRKHSCCQKSGRKKFPRGLTSSVAGDIMIMRVTAKVKASRTSAMPILTQIRNLEPTCHLLTALYESRVLFVLLRLCTKASITKHEVSLSGARAPLWREGRGGEEPSPQRIGALSGTL